VIFTRMSVISTRKVWFWHAGEWFLHYACRSHSFACESYISYPGVCNENWACLNKNIFQNLCIFVWISHANVSFLHVCVSNFSTYTLSIQALYNLNSTVSKPNFWTHFNKSKDNTKPTTRFSFLYEIKILYFSYVQIW
jgi:hypothetical protein